MLTTTYHGMIQTFLFTALVAGIHGNNLLANLNADVETAVGDPDFHWTTYKDCVLQTDTSDSYSGQNSLKVTNRVVIQSGPTIALDNAVVQADHSYYYSVYVNFLTNASNSLTFNVSLKVRYTDNGSPTTYTSLKIADLRFQRPSTGWHRVAADVKVPAMDLKETEFFLTMDTKVDFLFDFATLEELPRPDPTTWKNDVAAKIQQERTNGITIRSQISENRNPADIEIQVNMTNNAFYFGSVLKADDFNDDTEFSANYRQFFFDNFNLAVLENALKWKSMEYTKGVRKTERVDTFMATMNSNGIPVRSHTAVWGKHAEQPRWLLDFTADPIGDPVVVRQEVNEWLNWFCNYYGKTFISYDVYNEYLQAQFYEEFFQDPDFIFDVFSRVANCTGDLYLNDFDVIRSGLDTTAMVNMANRLMDAGKRVQGIGLQCHVKEKHFDITTPDVISKRLEELCSVGLPVFISELTVLHPDVTERATKLDELLRYFYSEPCVVGINYWGFSSENTNDPLWALTEGTSVQVNEAGQIWRDLVKGEWFTTQTMQPTGAYEEYSFPGHHGDYTVTVTDKGEVIHSSVFTLAKGQDVVHDIDV